MAERFFAVNQISFSKNDLPLEGAAHNKALHLTVKCEGYYVKRVMLDGGSRVDIFPLSTLQRIEIGTERIRPNNVCVRAFDGIKRDTIGEIDLILTIGPVDFEVTFLVLDIDTSYNFLLGRPWIHAVGVVPSTLHQMVKFEHEYSKIVVHGEDEQSIYRDPSVPCLEAREGSEHTVYQAFEIMIMDQCKKGDPCPQPFLSNASIMVAKEMIRRGYKPGKGLGKLLQGIVKPIILAASEKFFGVGFQPTSADGKWVDERNNNGWVLPQPILHIYRTFVKPKYNEEEEDEAFTTEEIEEFCGAMRQMLSNNAALNNMTCLQTSCPDSNTLSNFNLGSSEEIRETTINIHTDEETRDTLIQLLFEFKDVFAWSYDDMPRLSVDLVVHKLPTYPDCPPVQQKQRKFKTDISDKIKEEVLMDEEDAEKTAFTTPWGTYCYRGMPFGLKNVGATYMRAMTAIFHDMMHQEIKVYVDDVIIKSRTQDDHVRDLRKFFERLRKYDLKLNPAKCAFGVPSNKLLGFIVSRRGIEMDPTKIKSIRDLPPPRTKKDVMSLLGRLNYISRFIAQLTSTYEPIFKLLKKDAAIKWTYECQEAFDKIKEYLSNPPVLVPPKPGRPLFLYLTVLEDSFGCVLG
ncbi:uncharacterized protein [Nicotiana sylvestris]|uniref:uncharacterized protein n=1 Tax=Nicotiana sylvestris TaxID=4096 RepID=UPI00388C8A14